MVKFDASKIYQASGVNNPEPTKLSNEVVTAQKKENAFLQDWQKRNGQ